jgi:hypothetical protein
VKSTVRRDLAATSPTELLCMQSKQYIAGGDIEFVANLRFCLEKRFISRAF